MASQSLPFAFASSSPLLPTSAGSSRAAGGGPRASTRASRATASNLAKVAPILDFGCGCGRVTRYWADQAVEVHGSDLNPKLVAWCRSGLAFATFAANGLEPPLAYADGRFGFVYALSVFTHLPETLQVAWMEELRRVLRPGGHLLLTTHGAHYLDELTEDERRHFRAGQLVVRRDDRPGSNVCGAYRPEAHVRERLAKGFSSWSSFRRAPSETPGRTCGCSGGSEALEL